MVEILDSLWALIVAGGPGAINGILLAIIVCLLWERNKMIEVIKRYQKITEENRNQFTDSIIQIIDRYHAGNLELVQALNEIRVVLSTMQKTII